MPSISAYLSVYNDTDLLEAVLRSIRGVVDELVIVDGGYHWMEPFLRATGKDPARSDEHLYDIVKHSGIPFRSVNRVWSNEIEKRKAGYAACTTEYVLRVDADEVSFFDHDALSEFIQAGGAVAQMDMPMYDSPGLIQCKGPDVPMPRQGFLFNRSKIDASQHLIYLWLVLTAEQVEERERQPIFKRSIAFNAHLSHWRTPEGGMQRAVFYVLNYLRGPDSVWTPELGKQPLSDPEAFFRAIPPSIFRSAMRRSPVTNGQYHVNDGHLCPTPLTREQEAEFVHLYDRFVDATRRLNRQSLVEEQGFVSGQHLCFHLDRTMFDRIDRQIAIRFSQPISGAQAHLNDVYLKAPIMERVELKVELQSENLIIRLPDESGRDEKAIRTILTLAVWGANSSVGTFLLETDLG